MDNRGALNSLVIKVATLVRPPNFLNKQRGESTRLMHLPVQFKVVVDVQIQGMFRVQVAPVQSIHQVMQAMSVQEQLLSKPVP
jgi:calcineurin-like phosphoesterase